MTPTKPTTPTKSTSIETAKRVLRIESEAIADLIARVDSRFDEAVDLLLACQGRVVVAGLGKSGLIGRKIAATFASTGSPALFLHAGEALHGDLGMLISRRRAGRRYSERRNTGTGRADRSREAARHSADHAYRGAAFDDRRGKRHRARHRGERRSLLAESRAHSFYRRRNGDGRRARRRCATNAVASKKKISPRFIPADASARNCGASNR